MTNEAELLLQLLQEADNIEDNTFNGEGFDLAEYEVADVVAISKQADVAYEEGEPILSDRLSNAIREYLLLAVPSETYNLVVGSDVRGGKIPLAYAMGSLTQSHDDNDLQMWKLKHGLTERTIFCATEKLDGMAGSLHGNNEGTLRIAYSRGNGTEGADITRHVKHIRGLPKYIPPNLEVRCEIIISKENFEKVRKLVFRSDGSEYKNARNMISGLMNSSEIDPIAYNYIDCVVYHDWNEVGGNGKSVQLEQFTEMGFKVPEWETLTGGQINATYLTMLVKRMKEDSEYELDGVVIEADSAADRMRMNPSKATLNPEYARKFKIVDERNNAIATVDYVELRVSKRGYIIPRVHYIPFSLPGITCTHSTGYNMKFIIENGICPGAKVHMYRAGDVIPNILRSHEKGPYTMEDYIEQLDDIGEWKWTENDAGEQVHAVLVGEHANIGMKLAEAFFTAIGVDGLKLGNLKKLFEGKIDTPEKIIKSTLDELAFFLGSMSTAEKIHASLHKALRSNTLPRFMGATGLFGRGIGKTRVQLLFDTLGPEILTYNAGHGLAKLMLVEKFNIKTATKFLNGLPSYLAFYESVKEYVTFVEKEVVEGALNGQVFVFSGFRNKQLQEKLEAAGGTCVDTFSGKVTCVIAADPDDNTGKIGKARSKGIKIIGIGDVDELIG